MMARSYFGWFVFPSLTKSDSRQQISQLLIQSIENACIQWKDACDFAALSDDVDGPSFAGNARATRSKIHETAAILLRDLQLKHSINTADHSTIIGYANRNGVIIGEDGDSSSEVHFHPSIPFEDTGTLLDEFGQAGLQRHFSLICRLFASLSACEGLFHALVKGIVDSTDVLVIASRAYSFAQAALAVAEVAEALLSYPLTCPEYTWSFIELAVGGHGSTASDGSAAVPVLEPAIDTLLCGVITPANAAGSCSAASQPQVFVNLTLTAIYTSLFGCHDYDPIKDIAGGDHRLPAFVSAEGAAANPHMPAQHEFRSQAAAGATFGSNGLSGIDMLLSAGGPTPQVPLIAGNNSMSEMEQGVHLLSAASSPEEPDTVIPTQDSLVADAPRVTEEMYESRQLVYSAAGLRTVHVHRFIESQDYDDRGPEPVVKALIDPRVNPAPFAAARKRLERCSISELRELLTLNRMKRTGTKEELVDRCIDAAVNGCVPRCPQCKQGFLRMEWQRGVAQYYCPGGFNEEILQKTECDFRSKHVERAPWRWHPT